MMPKLRGSLHDDNLISVLTFAHTWVNITINTIHAIVIFLFNSMAREVLWALIRQKKKPTKTVTITTTKTKPALAGSRTTP
uniref:Uncharacterized protein n=1 Tax=Acrobeloides nanus TaxID=290746 RepID=A0A914CMR7_9BILA